MNIFRVENTIFREKNMHLCYASTFNKRPYKILLCVHNILKIFFNFVAKKIE